MKILASTAKVIWDEIKDMPNIVGYSKSPKARIENGKEVPDTKVIRVYVSKKLKKAELRSNEVVPRYIANGTEIYETDVIEIGEIKALSCCGPDEDEITAEADISDGRRYRHRPLAIGPSAMGVWEGATACTLGGFARNKKPGEEEFIGILANNHCGARENKAVKGTPYIQPSPMDGGSMPADLVGRLWRYVSLGFKSNTCPYRNAAKQAWRALAGIDSESITNRVDISLIKLEDGIDYNLDLHGHGPSLGKRDAVDGDLVEKFGRTTGYTGNGEVIDVDWSGMVAYGRGKIMFDDCVLVFGNKFSQGGDSSSFTRTKDDKMYIGNLFAGSDISAIICKGKHVESDLEVEVLI